VQPEIAKDGTVSPGACGTAGLIVPNQKGAALAGGGTLMYHPPAQPAINGSVVAGPIRSC
jgi:hypothetical protein